MIAYNNDGSLKLVELVQKIAHVLFLHARLIWGNRERRG